MTARAPSASRLETDTAAVEMVRGADQVCPRLSERRTATVECVATEAPERIGSCRSLEEPTRDASHNRPDAGVRSLRPACPQNNVSGR